MAEVLLVVDREDAGAAMLGAAFRRHGWRARVLDLRFGRPTLDGSHEVPIVRLDGSPVTPDVVINRSDTSRLGLPPATTHARQIATTWLARHIAAREEQGLLLACLDLWDRTSRLYNPPGAVDRALLRRPVEADMLARGLPVGRRPTTGTATSATIGREPGGEAAPGGGVADRRVGLGGVPDRHRQRHREDGPGGVLPAPGSDQSTDGREGVCWVVDGTLLVPGTRLVGEEWQPVELSVGTAEAIRQVADLAGLRLGRIDLWQSRSGGTLVTGWHPIPPFRDFWERTGIDVAALVAAAIIGEEPAPAPGFLVAGFEAGFLDIQARSAAGRL
jgi:hypothetical protein